MKQKLWSLITLTVFFLACVTVNIYFPVTAAEKTAEEIVKEVREQISEKEEEEIKPPSEPEAGYWQFVGVVYAQEGALDVSTASIRALKASIKQRYPALIPYLRDGIMGENRSGLLEVRTWEGLALRDKAKVKQLTEAENKDRMGLYKEVAKALQIDLSQLERLQKIFAQEWQKTVPPGSWIETEDGKWVKK